MEHFLNLGKSRSLIGNADIGSVFDFSNLFWHSTQSPTWGGKG